MSYGLNYTIIYLANK